MRRYFEKDNFERLCRDFDFLVDKIKSSKGELDLRLRDQYFNLYYKGNSLAKVTPKKDDYEIVIHNKFCREIFKDDSRFSINVSDKSDYCVACVKADSLPAFFQQKYLEKLCRNIKEVHNGEEITFEQMLITDNLNRQDLIIIDRQVTETGMDGKLDLLALRQRSANNFNFEVVEVKLGNNKELKDDVADQLSRYIRHIKSNVSDWTHCYKEVYRQMKVLKLLGTLPWDTIEIEDDVSGLVAVGGYTGMAKESLSNFILKYPQFKYKFFENRL